MSTTINAGRIAPLPKGTYNASTAYTKLDIVTYQGSSSYICKQACQGIAPTNGDYWQLLASGGSGSEDLMITATKMPGANTYYDLDYTWQELMARLNDDLGGGNMFVQLQLPNNDWIKLPFIVFDTDGMLHFGAEYRDPISGVVSNYDLFYGDDGFADLTTTPLQEKLVSGTNIKTINSSSLLGSGDITIPAGPQGPQGEPGPQGPQGESGVDLGEAVLINDLTTGGATNVLSAEMGKYLYESASQNYVKGFYLNQNDGLTFKGTWNFMPDYIPCTQGDSLVWTPGVVLTLARLIFYDSNKSLLTSYTANSAQRTITAPANTAYVRISFNDMNGSVENTIPLKINNVEYPKTDDRLGVRDLPITRIPSAIGNNLYGYLYNHFGITDVPTDAMLFENKTIQGTYVSLSGTRCIAQLPVSFGYGIRVAPTSGYKIDLRLCTYEQVDSGQISASTIISTNGVTTDPITASIPHGAHMAVIWVAKTTDAVITTDEAKLGFSVQMVKIPDVPRLVESVNHRGYNTTHPENTLVAFQESRRQGFFYVETDVRTTSDGVIVLLHDASINRTARNADGTSISGTINIASITYTQALDYDFGIAKGSQFAGTKIPTLAQFLALCKRLSLHPILEIKDVNISALVSEVASAGMRGNVTYLGSVANLASVKAIDPYARLAILGDSTTIEQYNSLKSDTNEVIVDITYNVSFTTLKDAGIPIGVYVVDGTNYLDTMDSYISMVTSNSLVADRYLYLSNILGD